MMSLGVTDWTTFSAAVNPWDRQDGESRKAYLAFETYRDMAEEPRSYVKVAQALHKSLALIGRWGAKWRWQTRLRAWQTYLESVATAERVRAIKEINERHASIARQCLEKIAETLNDPNGGPIPMRVMAKLLIAAVDVERLAMGLTTECGADGASSSYPNSGSTQQTEHETIVSERFKALSAVDCSLLRQAYIRFINSLEDGGDGELAKCMRTALQGGDG
jgi:hypothetical protein